MRVCVRTHGQAVIAFVRGDVAEYSELVHKVSPDIQNRVLFKVDLLNALFAPSLAKNTFCKIELFSNTNDNVRFTLDSSAPVSTKGCLSVMPGCPHHITMAGG